MRKTFAVIALLALVAGMASARHWVPLETGQPERAAEFRVVSSNSFRTVVELELAGVYVDDVQADGRTWQTVELGIAAGGLLTEQGSPQLPVVARFLRIPDNRAVRVEVIEIEEVVLDDYRVLPAQAPLREDQLSVPFTIDEKRYGTDALYPAPSERVSDPMIMRDLRLVQLVLQPVRYNPVSGKLRVAKRLRVALISDGPGRINVKHRNRPGVSRAFEPLYRRLVANYDFGPPQEPMDGSYLIITHDDFASAVVPFAAWKTRKGWRTTVVTTTELGGNDSAHIDAYITDAYNNWPYPPDYVLLVGDAPNQLRCCHRSGNIDASDLPYSCKEGGDILADLMIGRVCVQNLTEAQTALNKLYKCEKEPYMLNPDWFSKACAIAAYESSPRFWSVVIRIRNYVMGRPFTQFDTLFQRWGLNTHQGLNDSLNLGRAWMLYRGHGGVDCWGNVNPDWTNTSVHNLNNGRMTPLVIGPTCLAGDFDNAQDCLAETWVKAGSPDSAKGGTGYFGSSEASYSGYNDTLALGCFMSHVDSLLQTFGQNTFFAKLLMLEAYPLPDPTSVREVWMFNTLGEPEFNPWSATPQILTVSHPATVIIGQFPFQVTVNGNDAPVENALVCVMSRADTSIYHMGYTDGAGQVQFTIEATQPGDSILVTVTGRNLHPYLGTAMTISPNAAYVTHLRHTVSDSAGGNNDGIINPGEVIDLSMWIRNWGSVAADSVYGTLRTGDVSIGLTDSVEYFGPVGIGDSAFAADAYRFGVAHACTNGYVLRFELACRDANDSVWVSGLNLWVGTAVLEYSGYDVDDPPPGGNGDGKIDPGETAQLTLSLHNRGLGHGYNVSAVLRSGDVRFAVSDSLGEFGDIMKDSVGSNGADRFTVTADGVIPMETPIPCTLLVTADGYAAAIPFTVVVGEIRSVDPIPDNAAPTALYWAYDSGDTNYVQHPTFEWIDISGVGTRLTLSDDQTVQVNLPSGFGPFVYYGRNFTQVSICGNGWVGPGRTTSRDYTNHAIPNTTDPTMLAMVWDDLYPPSSNGVYWYHDAANHRFIVQYDSMPYYSSRTTFDWHQVVIYDTTLAATDGNSVFTYQYLTANGYGSATVGINDSTSGIGIQVLCDGAYHRGALPIEAGGAIKYTTDGPVTGIAEPGKPAALARQALIVAPNPFARSAIIHWNLAHESDVSLKVFDATGRAVRTLVNGPTRAGTHTTLWNGTDDRGRELAHGIYFVRLETAGSTVKVKTILTR